MTAQKGLAPILIILIVAVLGIGALATTALLGQAPQCPNTTGPARTEKVIGDLLEKSGSVTATDSEATTIAQKFVASKAQNVRVCFTQGSAHASGNIQLGSLTPSFYASSGIDLSGPAPITSNLDIRVGSLPNIPVLSSQVESFVSKLINENLAKVNLKKKYSIQFSQGSATVNQLSK